MRKQVYKKQKNRVNRRSSYFDLQSQKKFTKMRVTVKAPSQTVLEKCLLKGKLLFRGLKPKFLVVKLFTASGARL